MLNKKITIAFTGASGSIYGLTLLKYCAMYFDEIYLIISKAAYVVLKTEINLLLTEEPIKDQKILSEYLNISPNVIKIFQLNNWFSPVASGSACTSHMIICPCSMGTIASINHRMSQNLIERAADVILKENKKLIIMFREMPLSTIHLTNLLELSKKNVTIIPASPGFYNQPKTIQELVDFVIHRILDHLNIQMESTKRWCIDKNT